MTDIERTYRSLMDACALSADAKDRIAREALARGASAQCGAGASGPAAAGDRVSQPRPAASPSNSAGAAPKAAVGSRPAAQRVVSRRRFLAYGAAAACAIAAVGVVSAGAPGRIWDALFPASSESRGSAGSPWFALKAYAEEGDGAGEAAVPPAGTEVELDFFMPNAGELNFATGRQTTYFQFDFSLVGNGIESATFAFESEGARGAFAPARPSIGGTVIGFAETRSYTVYLTEEEAKNGGAEGQRNRDADHTIPSSRTSVPKHMESFTVDGDDQIGLLGTDGDGSVTRRVYVQTNMSPAYRRAIERKYELLHTETSPIPPENDTDEEAAEAQLEKLDAYEERELVRKREYAQIDAITMHETGIALSKRPLVVTVTFDTGDVQSKRYRISPLPVDEIAARLQPDEDGNRDPGLYAWSEPEKRSAPCYTITEIDD